ncbi:MAG: type II and III secretion system protein, partial [Candidatus Omnitrophica bacterium]|nr:type II and III secretion system protein [Candidatus Omnitrophota bacterium]
IHPEVSSVGRTLDTSNGNAIPIVSTTNATTQVTVKDGHTVLIGGLMKDEVSKAVDKFPFLGDIPILGAFFRTTNNSITKTELVIFLTPHIVEGNEFSQADFQRSDARNPGGGGTSTLQKSYIRAVKEKRNDFSQEIETRLTKLRERSQTS